MQLPFRPFSIDFAQFCCRGVDDSTIEYDNSDTVSICSSTTCMKDVLSVIS